MATARYSDHALLPGLSRDRQDGDDEQRRRMADEPGGTAGGALTSQSGLDAKPPENSNDAQSSSGSLAQTSRKPTKDSNPTTPRPTRPPRKKRQLRGPSPVQARATRRRRE